MRKIKDEFILTKNKISYEKKCYLPIKNCDIAKEEVIHGEVEFSDIFMLVNKDDPEKVFVDVDKHLPMIFTRSIIAHIYQMVYEKPVDNHYLPVLKSITFFIGKC